MEHEELTRKIDAYLEENWETMVEDIETLVRIPSFEESDKATARARKATSSVAARSTTRAPAWWRCTP